MSNFEEEKRAAAPEKSPLIDEEFLKDVEILGPQELAKILDKPINSDAKDIFGFKPRGAGREPIEKRVIIEVPKGNSYARMKLKEPEDGDRAINIDEMLGEIKDAGITYGVRMDFLTRLGKQPIFNEWFRIAEGVPVQNGEKGSVEYLFDMKPEAKFTQDERGNIDFKELNIIKNVVKGEPLCNVIAPTEGIDGVDVFGNVIPSQDGKPIFVPVGSNTALSEDGTQIIAAMDGYVALKNDRVVVENILTLKDVDANTGNIQFNGSVVVSGDVKSGFSIVADNDVVVEGIVEDAFIKAGANVVLKKGANSRGCKIICGGSVKADFIENTKIEADGDVVADTIINADIRCSGEIRMEGKYACIMSGMCMAHKGISAKQIGNRTHVPTKIYLLGPNSVRNQVEILETKLDEHEKTFEKLGVLMEAANTSASMSQFQRLEILEKTKESRKRLEEEMGIIGEELDKCRELMNIPVGNIRVSQHMHTNVTIEIDGVVFVNSSPKDRCIISNESGRIVLKPMM